MSKTISILGCGWLGLPFGRHLLTKGFRVKGSLTSKDRSGDLARAGIEPYQLVLQTQKAIVSDEHFFETDVLVIAIPPARDKTIETIFTAQIRQLVPYITKHQIARVLFISSTSVYNENDQRVKEEDALIPNKPSGRALLIVENLLQENPAFKTTVIRFGGLIGKDRNPARFLLRKKETLSGMKPVNLIHQDDCISILTQIIRDDVWGETFNASCPEHPTRKAFYTKASEVSGLPCPAMNETAASYKLVDSNKLIQKIKYSFKYKNPLDYLSQLDIESQVN